MIVLSPEISGFEKKAPQLSHLEHFETRRLLKSWDDVLQI